MASVITQTTDPFEKLHAVGLANLSVEAKHGDDERFLVQHRPLHGRFKNRLPVEEIQDLVNALHINRIKRWNALSDCYVVDDSAMSVALDYDLATDSYQFCSHIYVVDAG